MNSLEFSKALSATRKSGKEISISYLGPEEYLPDDWQTQTKDRIPPNQRELLDYKTAAEMLSISTQALRDLVYKNKGPATCQVGTRTFFRPEDLKAYADKHRIPEPAPVINDPIKRSRGRPRIVEKK